MAGELGEPALGFRAGRSGQCRTIDVGAHLGEELAAVEGLFGLGLVAEPGVAGTGVALEHLNALMAVLQGPGNGAAGSAGDEPGQGASELPERQVRQVPLAFGYAAPVLTAWAVGHASLREVTSTDVTEALKEVIGTTAGDPHVALRSLFGALRQERRIFRDLSRGISLPGHTRPPVSPPTGLLPQLFDRAEDRLTRVIVVLLAVHAMTPTAVRLLQLTQVDTANARIDLRSATRSTSTWMS